MASKPNPVAHNLKLEDKQLPKPPPSTTHASDFESTGSSSSTFSVALQAGPLGLAVAKQPGEYELRITKATKQAEKLGLLVGDVVVAFNGQPYSGGPAAFKKLVQAAGRPFRITLHRSKRRTGALKYVNVEPFSSPTSVEQSSLAAELASSPVATTAASPGTLGGETSPEVSVNVASSPPPPKLLDVTSKATSTRKAEKYTSANLQCQNSQTLDFDPTKEEIRPEMRRKDDEGALAIADEAKSRLAHSERIRQIQAALEADDAMRTAYTKRAAGAAAAAAAAAEPKEVVEEAPCSAVTAAASTMAFAEDNGVKQKAQKALLAGSQIKEKEKECEQKKEPRRALPAAVAVGSLAPKSCGVRSGSVEQEGTSEVAGECGRAGEDVPTNDSLPVEGENRRRRSRGPQRGESAIVALTSPSKSSQPTAACTEDLSLAAASSVPPPAPPSLEQETETPLPLILRCTHALAKTKGEGEEDILLKPALWPKQGTPTKSDPGDGAFEMAGSIDEDDDGADVDDDELVPEAVLKGDYTGSVYKSTPDGGAGNEDSAAAAAAAACHGSVLKDDEGLSSDEEEDGSDDENDDDYEEGPSSGGVDEDPDDPLEDELGVAWLKHYFHEHDGDKDKGDEDSDSDDESDNDKDDGGAKDEVGSPLHRAALEGHVPVLAWLLRPMQPLVGETPRQQQQSSPSSSLSGTSSPSASPLARNCSKEEEEEEGDEEGGRRKRSHYYSSGDLDTLNARGLSPLHLACLRGHLSACKWLVAQGADPHLPSSRGRQTPLHVAASKGHARVAKWLLTHGCDEDNKTEEERPAADFGGSEDHGGVGSGEKRRRPSSGVAISKDLFAFDVHGWTPLHACAASGHATCLKVLLHATDDGLQAAVPQAASDDEKDEHGQDCAQAFATSTAAAAATSSSSAVNSTRTSYPENATALPRDRDQAFSTAVAGISDWAEGKERQRPHQQKETTKEAARAGEYSCLEERHALAFVAAAAVNRASSAVGAVHTLTHRPFRASLPHLPNPVPVASILLAAASARRANTASSVLAPSSSSSSTECTSKRPSSSSSSSSSANAVSKPRAEFPARPPLLTRVADGFGRGNLPIHVASAAGATSCVRELLRHDRRLIEAAAGRRRARLYQQQATATAVAAAAAAVTAAVAETVEAKANEDEDEARYKETVQNPRSLPSSLAFASQHNDSGGRHRQPQQQQQQNHYRRRHDLGQPEEEVDQQQETLLVPLASVRNSGGAWPCLLAAENGHLDTLKALAVAAATLGSVKEKRKEGGGGAAALRKAHNRNGLGKQGVAKKKKDEELGERQCSDLRARTSTEGFPPLHYACAQGHVQVCCWLLLHGGLCGEEPVGEVGGGGVRNGSAKSSSRRGSSSSSSSSSMDSSFAGRNASSAAAAAAQLFKVGVGVGGAVVVTLQGERRRTMSGDLGFDLGQGGLDPRVQANGQGGVHDKSKSARSFSADFFGGGDGGGISKRRPASPRDAYLYPGDRSSGGGEGRRACREDEEGSAAAAAAAAAEEEEDEGEEAGDCDRLSDHVDGPLVRRMAMVMSVGILSSSSSSSSSSSDGSGRSGGGPFTSDTLFGGGGLLVGGSSSSSSLRSSTLSSSSSSSSSSRLLAQETRTALTHWAEQQLTLHATFVATILFGATTIGHPRRRHRSEDKAAAVGPSPKRGEPPLVDTSKELAEEPKPPQRCLTPTPDELQEDAVDHHHHSCGCGGGLGGRMTPTPDDEGTVLNTTSKAFGLGSPEIRFLRGLASSDSGGGGGSDFVSRSLFDSVSASRKGGDRNGLFGHAQQESACDEEEVETIGKAVGEAIGGGCPTKGLPVLRLDDRESADGVAAPENSSSPPCSYLPPPLPPLAPPNAPSPSRALILIADMLGVPRGRPLRHLREFVGIRRQGSMGGRLGLGGSRVSGGFVGVGRSSGW